MMDTVVFWSSVDVNPNVHTCAHTRTHTRTRTHTHTHTHTPLPAQEKLLEQIHFHLTGSDDLDSCSEEYCLPHQKFALNIMERVRT